MRRLLVLCLSFVLLAGVAGAQSGRFSGAQPGARAAGHAASLLAASRPFHRITGAA
jgi:hypothetical protein